MLARWIVDAHARGQTFGLRLPGNDIPPQPGDAQRRRCLAAIARFEAPDPRCRLSARKRSAGSPGPWRGWSPRSGRTCCTCRAGSPAFVLAICAWRLIAERRGWRLPGTLLRGVIAAGVTAGVVLGYSTITGLDGGTALLALMSALKLLETRIARDHTVLIFIGWFLCLAVFLYAQDIVDRRLGAADRLAARGGAPAVSRARRRAARRCAVPHDRRHAAEGRAGRARAVPLLSADRGQLLGRAFGGARAVRDSPRRCRPATSRT